MLRLLLLALVLIVLCVLHITAIHLARGPLGAPRPTVEEIGQ